MVHRFTVGHDHKGSSCYRQPAAHLFLMGRGITLVLVVQCALREDGRKGNGPVM